MREPEVVDDALAAEIIASITSSNAWGFRIRTLPIYAGSPLRLRVDDGEIRLFHKRHYLRHAAETSVQGTVIRLLNPFRAITFESSAAHREYLARSAKRHSPILQMAFFLRDAIATRTADANTLRYIWTEAGFEKT